MSSLKLTNSVHYQEELFTYLLTEEGFKEFGMFVQPDAFTLEYLTLSWECVRNFYYKMKALPSLPQLSEELYSLSYSKDVIKEVNKKMVEVLSLEIKNERFIKDTLIKFIRRVKLRNLAEDMLLQAETGEVGSLMEIGNQATEALTFGIPITDESFFTNAKKRFLDYATGDLNEYINVGLGDKIQVARGEIGVVLAPPKRGKSFSLINIGYGALTYGSKVLHITLELRKSATEMRYDRAITALTKRMLRDTDRHEQALKLISRLKKLRGDLIVEEFSSGRCSVETIYGILNLYKNRGREFDLLIVDYATLVEPRRGYNDRRHEISLVYTDLRALAKEFNLAVWTAAQTRRSTLSAEIFTMEEIAEDIGIAAVSDLLVALCQTKDEHESVPEAARLFVTGARETEDQCMFNCRLDRDIARLYIEE